MARTLILVTCIALLAVGCGEEQQKKAEQFGKTLGEKAGAAWSKAKTFTIEQKDELVGWWNEKKPDAQAAYESAKKKAAEAGEDAEQALDASWEKLQEAWAKIPEATKEGWQAARDAVIAAYEAFKAEAAKHD